ncbi:MAG: cache domain-containing protein, partial [Geopsychrobacter sp.]|nr:cache domain-containing protein [Geopsychrobacter sp.]
MIRISLNGLRSRILLVVGCAVLLTTASIAFLAQREMEATVFNSEDRHAQYLLRMALLNVESEYESLLFHKKTTLERRKQGLKNIVDISMANINEVYEKFLRGELSEAEAKRQAIQTTRRYRYDNGVGYLWINDLGKPFPRLIMHPILPELEGKKLDAPRYFTALGMHKHILKAMVEVAQATGSGYINYLWPKPVAGKLTADQPKISYVTLFKGWNWIIGTGVYVDDIEKEVNERQKAIITELNETFAKISIADSGYIFIFNGDKQMLVHPNIKDQDLSKLKDPQTGNFIIDELITASKNPEQSFNYLWDRPDHQGDFRFKKRAYVSHFKPLDWYIVSSVYTDEIAQPAIKLRARIIYLSLLSLFAGLIVSLVLARNLVKPLQKLTLAAKEIETKGVDAKIQIPISGASETRQLGSVLEKMVNSIRQASDEKEQA